MQNAPFHVRAANAAALINARLAAAGISGLNVAACHTGVNGVTDDSIVCCTRGGGTRVNLQTVAAVAAYGDAEIYSMLGIIYWHVE